MKMMDQSSRRESLRRLSVSDLVSIVNVSSISSSSQFSNDQFNNLITSIDTVLTNDNFDTVSTVSTLASLENFCRFCHAGDQHEKLISPCYCSGTMANVHPQCLQKWASYSSSNHCICGYDFKSIKKFPSCFQVCTNSLLDFIIIKLFPIFSGSKLLSWIHSTELNCLLYS